MKKPVWLGVVVVACSLLAACNNDGIPQNSADLRVVHAVPGAASLDVLVNDDVKAAGLTFASTSEFTNFKAGTRHVKVRSTSGGTVHMEREITFIDGSRTTLLVVGHPELMSTLALIDDYIRPRSGKIAVRMASLTANLFPVDLYFGGADISAATPLVSNVPSASTSNYLEMDEGTYSIVITYTGTKDVVFRAEPRAFSSGSENTIATFPAVGGNLSNALLLNLDGGTYIANPLARARAVNAIPGAVLNFKSDNTSFANDVVFSSVSSYMTSASGARTLQLAASNVPGTNISTLARTLDPAGDFTVVAVNTLAQPELVTFADANLFPATGVANVRFANVLPSAPSVDARMNNDIKGAGVAYKTATATTPITLAANTTYTFTFTSPGGVTPIATLPDVTLEGAAVYTVWLFGPESAPHVRLIRDR